MNRELLKELSAKSFMALDLQLYIDTHPENREAIVQYNEAVKDLNRLQAEYERAVGPLYSFISPSAPDRFTWIDSPWPWEND